MRLFRTFNDEEGLIPPIKALRELCTNTLGLKEARDAIYDMAHEKLPWDVPERYIQLQGDAACFALRAKELGFTVVNYVEIVLPDELFKI